MTFQEVMDELRPILEGMDRQNPDQLGTVIGLLVLLLMKSGGGPPGPP